MAAELIAAPGGGHPHLLRLPGPEQAAELLEEVRYGLAASGSLDAPLARPLAGTVILQSGGWALHTDELRRIAELLQGAGLQLMAVEGHCATTLVAAAALGLASRWAEPAAAERGAEAGAGRRAAQPGAPSPQEAALVVQRGTLRSGDHLQAEGSALVLGDVNPGARVSAGGHVLVWGRLRGVAHAGRHGDASARIVALQLQPLQLRIADAVARGPEERPPLGLAEQARLVAGEIRIEPAPPHWPHGT
jgi:septum site-determining protein MinC